MNNYSLCINPLLGSEHAKHISYSFIIKPRRRQFSSTSQPFGTPLDTQTKYLQDFFGFLGLQDVDFIYAEGLAMPDKEQSIASAMTQIEK
ncbi:MAG TPA: hypothetical protein DCE62_03255, partial [Glaciecola sp.]|nr:hypothetical protein [Glaciecola sp.]